MINKKATGFCLLVSCLLGCIPFAQARPHRRFQDFGNIAQIAIPISAGLISAAKQDYVGVIHLSEGQLYNQLTAELLKRTVREKRPNGANHLSFPSGHTISAMNSAAYMQFRYGWHYGLPYYIIGAAVGYSRVNARQHYWRDVIGSTIIATGMQYLINNEGMSIAPYITPDSVGVSLHESF